MPKSTGNRVSKVYLYTRVHSRVIHYSQEVEATELPIDIWRDKQNVVYIEYYSALKKKEILPYAATAWKNLENMMLHKIRQSQEE